jgi:hypothetical protein
VGDRRERVLVVTGNQKRPRSAPVAGDSNVILARLNMLADFVRKYGAGAKLHGVQIGRRGNAVVQMDHETFWRIVDDQLDSSKGARNVVEEVSHNVTLRQYVITWSCVGTMGGLKIQTTVLESQRRR